jgi:hypothetical protein
MDLAVKQYVLLIGVQIMKLVNPPRNKCLRFSLMYTFIVIRLAIIVCFIGYLIPTYYYIWCDCMTLQKRNWWHSKDEKFFTNASGLNCFWCWLIWLGAEMFCVYIVVIPLVIIIQLLKGNLRCSHIVAVFPMMWEGFKSYLFARAFVMPGSEPSSRSAE